MPSCQICGWAIEPICKTVMSAVLCGNNKENWRKYTLRFKGEIARGEMQTPTLVKSTRGYDVTDKDGPGKGNFYERLEPVTIEAARVILHDHDHDHNHASA